MFQKSLGMIFCDNFEVRQTAKIKYISLFIQEVHFYGLGKYKVGSKNQVA